MTGNEDIILVSIGGNDVGFADVVMKCFLEDEAATIYAGVASDTAGCDAQMTQAFDDSPKRFSTNSDDTYTYGVAYKLRRIAEKAPHAQIVYMGYPLLEELDWMQVAGLDVGAKVRQGGRELQASQTTMVQALNALPTIGGRIHFVPLVNIFATHEPDGRMLSENTSRWMWEFPGVLL